MSSITPEPVKQQLVIDCITTRLEAMLFQHSYVASPPLGSPLCTSPPNDLSPGRSPTNSSPAPPALRRLKVDQYVKRLAQFLQCPLECLLVGLLLVQRLDQVASRYDPLASAEWPEADQWHKVLEEDEDRETAEEREQQSRLDLLSFGKDKAQLLTCFLAATVVGIKTLCDSYESMVMYAHIGGVHNRLLCAWEVKLMTLLHFDIAVDSKELARLMVECGGTSPLIVVSEESVAFPSTPLSTSTGAGKGLEPQGDSPSSAIIGCQGEGGLSTSTSVSTSLCEDDDEFATPTIVCGQSLQHHQSAFAV